MAKLLNPGGLEQLTLLALLRLSREDAYGVPIHEEIQARTGRSVAASAIYITLDRLVKKDYIASHLGEPTPERGGRAKRYFTITALGERALRESFSLVSRMAGELKPRLEGSHLE